MRCLIVDDEPLAQQVMVEFAGRVPFLNVAAVCSSATEAAEVLRNTTIDLILLDIHMPRISGLEFISSYPNPPQFILVTAYSEYALQGFNVNATDYLMKPVPFDRFLKAVNKAYELFRLRKAGTVSDMQSQRFILVKSGYQTIKVVLETILYIEGLKDYVKIYTEGKKPILSLLTMKGLVETLPEEKFMRIHKSFIISTERISAISRNRVMIGDKWIPVGENYRDAFRNKMFNK
ncbi:MAG TPA: LytTR family DNA-binding domain-containing protein [Bacteroidales bacterium]|nr:LytTR family DNA-binding domain-containing protein [Bacteroidales bacterium]